MRFDTPPRRGSRELLGTSPLPNRKRSLEAFVLGEVIGDKLIRTKIQGRNASGWGLIHAEILWGPFHQEEEEDPAYDEPCTCSVYWRDPDDEALNRALEEAIERGESIPVCSFSHRLLIWCDC